MPEPARWGRNLAVHYLQTTVVCPYARMSRSGFLRISDWAVVQICDAGDARSGNVYVDDDGDVGFCGRLGFGLFREPWVPYLNMWLSPIGRIGSN